MIEKLTLIMVVLLIVLIVFLIFIQFNKKNGLQDQSDLKVYMQKEYEGLKTQLRELIYDSNSKNTKRSTSLEYIRY